MTPRQHRLWYVTLIGVFLGGITLIVLTTLNEQLLFFMTPADVLSKNPSTPIRLGGLVEHESILHQEESQEVTFRVTDGNHTVPVHYRGMLPDLFREGQGVVAEGILSPNGIFQATRLLAKHDETYMPREVADTLKANGQWQPSRKKTVETRP